MIYRAEIDGLRALAVVPVILFHAGLGSFHGGFVGVDVFFVISGYLITSIVAAEIEQGRFSVARFYERRARRILPALFLILTVTSLFAAVWIVPEGRAEYFQTVTGVVLFASNLVFWRQSGYFDSAAELKPLLHTWSLGVEEQFYVFFPLLLLLFFRAGKRRAVFLVIGTAVASLALAEWAVSRAPAASFFLLPTRAWELLVGAILALWQPTLPASARQAVSFVGMATVVLAIFFFDKSTPTPSVYTLLPVLGAAAVIACARIDTLVGRLLATRPLVGVGLISYSAYLWHQPLFALARLRSIEEPSAGVFVVLSALTVVLAYLTWRYVEAPFRRLASTRAIVSSSVAATAVLLSASVSAALVLQPSEVPQLTHGRCNVGEKECFASATAVRQVALWGDSYADAFATSLGRMLAQHGISLRLFVRNGCPSLIHLTRNEPGDAGRNAAQKCSSHNEAALQVIRQEKFDVVVLTSAYQTYLTEKNAAGESLLVSYGGASKNPAGMLPNHLRQTILATGSRVLLVTPHPVVREFQTERKKLHFSQVSQIYADYAGATATRAVILDQLSGTPFEEIDGRELLCTAGECPVVSGTRLLLYDGSHLGPYLSGILAAKITDAILRANPP